MKLENIGFAHDLVNPILDGSKTLTYRLGDKYDTLTLGDEVNVMDSLNNNLFAKVRITNKYWTTFGELPFNINGHEKYLSKEEQRNVFSKYYGRLLADSEQMLVLEFKVVK